jgi:hypothetical protein
VIVLIHITSAGFFCLWGIGYPIANMHESVCRLDDHGAQRTVLTLYASVSDIFNLLGHLAKHLLIFPVQSHLCISKSPFVALQNA